MDRCWRALAVAAATLAGSAHQPSARACRTCRWYSCCRAVLRSDALALGPRSRPSLFSFLAYNFFFIEPRSHLTVAKPHELLSLCHLPARRRSDGQPGGPGARTVARSTARASGSVQSLLDFSRKLSGALQPDDVLWVVATQAAATVQGQSIVLLRQGEDLPIVASCRPRTRSEPPTRPPPAGRSNAARQRAGAPAHCRMPAFISVRCDAPWRHRRARRRAGRHRTLRGDQAHDRCHSSSRPRSQSSAPAGRRSGSQARAAAEGEKLRSALLSSISHDLRTPLASIVGSVTALRRLGDQMPSRDRDDLLPNIEEEATRLSRFVTNLLDMTRLESGGVDVRRERSMSGKSLQPPSAGARASAAATHRHSNSAGSCACSW